MKKVVPFPISIFSTTMAIANRLSSYLTFVIFVITLVQKKR